MNGGKDCKGGVSEGAVHTAPVQVPIGWQRKVDPTSGVLYISPSGSVLSCLDQVKSYLLTDGTCKCGLECPLILPKVFNFDPGATVKQRTAEDVRADEDVTKLCIHKRKLLAVATLHKSMALPHPSLTLTSPGGGTSSTSMVPSHSTNPRAIRNKSHESLLPNSVVPNCKNPFKMMMTAAAGQRHFPQELGGPPQQQELYPGYPNRQQRLSSEPGPRSSYRSGYGSMLSPGGPGTQLYGPGDGSPLSPSLRSDPLGSPDGFRNNPCGFPGANSSSPIHGGNRTPLSPPGMLIHGSPAVAQTSVAQTSCAMSGRTSTPLSPTATAKSPVMMMKPVCNFPGPPSMDMPIQAPFHHKTQSGAPYPGPRPPHPGPPSAIPSSCTLQKKQMTSEKDPLGILDPIPSKPSISISQTNSNFQPSVHSSQVPMMNVNMNNHPPPAIVPLPSNLPLPTVKPGPVGHSHGSHMQRTQQQTSITSSMSPSPITSPVHMSGPVLGSRMEASPQRSRSSSTSSDHGSFAMPSGPSQGPCGGMKAPPRSPRSSMGSPRPTMPINMPSSPSSTRPDSHTLHQYKDLPSQLLVGMSNQNAINTQHNNPGMYPPATSSGPSITASHKAQNQKGQNHPGLLGMPLNQILNQQNAASFPASSLLSAAAKAQLANQNKHGDNSSETGSRGSGMGGGGPGRVDGNGGSSGVGHPNGPLSGTRSGIEGHSSSTLNPMLPPNSPMLMPSIAEAAAGGQSGRAALRDKLMAQQRDRGDPLLRKCKQQPPGPPPPNNTLNHHDSMVFNMLNKPPNTGGGPGPRLPPPSSAEQLRKVARLGGLPPNTSMAQLLQSMSNHQNQHQGPAGPTGPGQMHYSDGAGVMPPGASQQQNLLAQQRMLGQGEGQGMYCQSMDSGGPHSHGPRFPGLMNQIQANSLVNCGPLGPGGQVGLGPGNMPLSHHPNTNPPPLSHPSHPSQHPHQQHQQQHSHLHAALGRTSMSGMALGNSDGSCGQAISEPGDPSNIVNCSMGNMASLQPHVINSSSSGGTQVFQQHHAQPQLHQSIQRAMQGLPPGYQGSQQPGFSENNPFPDNNSSNSHPMACLFQNFQGCLPDNSISVPHSQMISQSGMTSLPESRGMLSHPQFSVSQREMQQTQGEGLPPGMHGSDRLPSGGVESVDAIYRAVVDAASKGMHVVITTTVSGTTQSSPVPTLSTMSAFTNSVGEPVSINHNLPHSHAAVSHSVHRVAHQEGEQTTTLSQQPRPRQVRAGRPRKNSGHGKSNVSIPEGHGALPEAPHQDYFRSPGRGTPRGQWEGETGLPGSLDGGHTAWAGEDFLECSTHVRSSPCMERPGSLAPAPPCPADSGPHEGHHSLPIPSDKAFLEDGFNRFNTCNRTAVNIINYKERLDQTVERCAHMNGGGVGPPQVQFSLRGYGVSDPLGPPRQGDLTGDDQSPSSSTSLEGPLVKEYVGHYNGHFNGGCAPSPSDTKSLSSEEDLRHPDSPLSEMLHYRPRTFNMGDLVWGQGFKGFPSWPGKLAGEEAGHNHHHHASLQLREESKVEPEKLKTLTHDLEALDRATKRNRKAGKLNNHLEAAIHEAMSELDKMSGTVHQLPSRDRQVKLPKPKRRKISR